VAVSVLFEHAGGAPFDEDLHLVDRFLGGDRHAFTRIYEKYFDKVTAISRGILLDADEAADAVQEIFTLVYRHLHKFDRRARFSTWLFRIAVNRSIQHARSSIQHARSGRHRTKHVELIEAADRPIEEREVEATDPRIATSMEKLQPADRALLTLFYWEELSLQEIADSIGCGVNAAKTRLFRARERFRQHYEDAGA